MRLYSFVKYELLQGVVAGKSFSKAASAGGDADQPRLTETLDLGTKALGEVGGFLIHLHTGGLEGLRARSLQPCCASRSARRG